MKYILILILLLALIPSAMAVNATVADIHFVKDFGVQINVVETNSAGSMAFAGLNNGSIIAMSSSGTVLYNTFVQDSVKSIVSDYTGDIVYSTYANRSGYINTAGTITGYNLSTVNVSDVDIANDGSDWVQFTNPTTGGGALYIRNPAGAILYENRSYGASNWSFGAYDSVNKLIVTGNTTNNSIFLWNVTNWTGWSNFNPTKSVRNSTLETLDSFPFRANITALNGDTATWSVGFTPSTTTPYITRVSASEYTYNISNTSTYFLWTNAFNLTLDQGLLLNHSLYNASTKVYNVTFKPSGLTRCVTMYFGKPAYSNVIVSNYEGKNNGTQIFSNFTGTSTWTAPANVTNVSIFVKGGGGGGGTGNHDSTSNFGRGGGGGLAGNETTSTSVTVVPGTSYSVVIGSGAYWSSDTDYVNALNSSVPALSVTAGGGLNGTSGDVADLACSNFFVHGGNGTDGYRLATYSNASSGDDTDDPTCTLKYGIGGGGFGAGGGGGAGQEGVSGIGRGGAGASGYVSFVYYVNDIPKYMVGTAPTSSTTTAVQNVTISNALSYVSYIVLSGNIQSLFIPESGGWVTVGTSAPAIYAQQIAATGFGTQYTGAASAGVSNDIASADSAAHFIDGRALGADIYQMSGTKVGSYATGGTVNSVDISEMDGLYSIAGSNDGKDYIFSKDTSSGWLVYYYSDASSTVKSVAVSNHGEYAASGRANGVFTYYDLFATPPASLASFTADIFVHKGGSAYVGKNITIVGGSVNQTSVTDTDGKVSFTATEQTTYIITVGNNEQVASYYGSTNYKTITINVPNPLLTTPYTYSAKYNGTTKLIAYTYHDVDNADVNIKIYDVTTKTNVLNMDYLGVKSADGTYSVGANTNHTFKVTFSFTRSPTGAKYQDSITIYPQSGINGMFSNYPEQWRLFGTFIYLFFVLGCFALTITKTSLKPGLLLFVGLFDLGMFIGLIPIDVSTISGAALVATVNLIVILMLFRRGND